MALNFGSSWSVLGGLVGEPLLGGGMAGQLLQNQLLAQQMPLILAGQQALQSQQQWHVPALPTSPFMQNTFSQGQGLAGFNASSSWMNAAGLQSAPTAGVFQQDVMNVLNFVPSLSGTSTMQGGGDPNWPQNLLWSFQAANPFTNPLTGGSSAVGAPTAQGYSNMLDVASFAVPGRGPVRPIRVRPGTFVPVRFDPAANVPTVVIQPATSVGLNPNPLVMSAGLPGYVFAPSLIGPPRPPPTFGIYNYGTPLQAGGSGLDMERMLPLRNLTLPLGPSGYVPPPAYGSNQGMLPSGGSPTPLPLSFASVWAGGGGSFTEPDATTDDAAYAVYGGGGGYSSGSGIEPPSGEPG